MCLSRNSVLDVVGMNVVLYICWRKMKLVRPFGLPGDRNRPITGDRSPDCSVLKIERIPFALRPCLFTGIGCSVADWLLESRRTFDSNCFSSSLLS